MIIKELIESKIKEKGFNKKSFAEKMGISPTNLNSMIESPSFPTLTKVADSLDMSLSELLDDGSYMKAIASSGVVCPHCGKPINVKLEP